MKLKKVGLLCAIGFAFSQPNAAELPNLEVIELSQKSAHKTIPKEEEKYENGRIENITQGNITIFKPLSDKNSGKAVIICPGGGYRIEAIDHEGYDFARWLASEGITGIVLKYRLPYGVKEIPLTDAQETIKLIRGKSKELGIDPSKIGICGFSAGGHLASTAGTHFDHDNRPDFMILFYPVISMADGIGHKGSRENLLGINADSTTISLYSNANRVTSSTPPTLILLSDDDKSVIPQNSIEFYTALKRENIPSSLYIFPQGGHGWGFRESFEYHNQVKDLILKWINKLN
ncbi:MAG: alpha/beta hydrolase [Bacteroidales bacterium]